MMTFFGSFSAEPQCASAGQAGTRGLVEDLGALDVVFDREEERVVFR